MCPTEEELRRCLGGVMGEAEAAQIEAHLQQDCPQCLEALQAMDDADAGEIAGALRRRPLIPPRPLSPGSDPTADPVRDDSPGAEPAPEDAPPPIPEGGTMADYQPTGRLSPDDRDKAICKRFEAAWRAGAGPRIEDYLEGVEGRERADLLGKLLRLELELRVEKGDRPASEPYRARWPEYGTVIDSAFDAKVPPQPAVVQGIELRPGAEPIPGYRLIHLLGEGGVAQVWKAVGPGGLEQALKFVRLDGPLGPAERRAIESVKHIRHPHLLAISGIWEVGRHLVIAMELAEGGRTLLDVFREAVGRGADGIPAPEIFEYFQDAARGIDYLNEPRHPAGGKGVLGVQHRDIKPQNLLLVGGCVKVGDYGLARVMERTLETASGTGGMTPTYAAPERFERRTSGQSDQYSLACTYCHMRGGRPPFTGTLAQIMRGHLEGQPDLSRLPERERAAVARALAKVSKDRWPSCRAFVEALRDAFAAGPPVTEPRDASPAHEADVGPRPGLPSRRGGSHRRRLSLLALAAVFACVALLARIFLIPGPKGSTGTRPPVMNPPSVDGGTTVSTDGLTPAKRVSTDRPTSAPSIAPSFVLDVPPSLTAGIGEKTPLTVKVRRNALNSPVTVRQTGQIEGVSIPEATIPADTDRVDLQVKVDLEASEGDREVHLIGTVGTGATRAEARITLRLAETAGTYIARGLAWVQRQEYDKAIADYSEAIRLNPKAFEAYFNRGSAWETKKEYDKAIADYSNAIRLDPKLANAYNNRLKIAGAYRTRGSTWKATREYDKAITDYTEAIRLNPKDADAYVDRGDAWETKKEYDKALDDYNEAIRLDPNNAKAYVGGGDARYGKKEYAQAIADYTEAIRLDPNNAKAYIMRGNAWDNTGQFVKALADYNEAIRLDPGSTWAHRERGIAWKARREYDKAIADYTEAIRLNPKDADAYVHRGSAWEQKREYAQAIADYTEAIRLDPMNAGAYNGRARIWATCPDPMYRDGQKAVASSTKACTMTGWNVPALLNNLAAAYAEAGLFDSAVEFQTKANALCRDVQDKTKGEARLNLYQQKKPYREANP